MGVVSCKQVQSYRADGMPVTFWPDIVVRRAVESVTDVDKNLFTQKAEELRCSSALRHTDHQLQRLLFLAMHGVLAKCGIILLDLEPPRGVLYVFHC